MKNINSKKARLEIATLINDLAFSEKATRSKHNDITENLYWMLISAEKIVRLNDVYGIPSIHYEGSLDIIKDPTFTNTREIMHKRSYEFKSKKA